MTSDDLVDTSGKFKGGSNCKDFPFLPESSFDNMDGKSSSYVDDDSSLNKNKHKVNDTNLDTKILAISK